MSAVLTIMGYGFREAVRRKMFTVVVLLTATFLVLFWLAVRYVFGRLSNIQPPGDVHERKRRHPTHGDRSSGTSAVRRRPIRRRREPSFRHC